MTTMLDLPDELIDDIFSRVPSESVRAARSTCKAWNALFYRWFAKKMEHNVKVTWKKQGSQMRSLLFSLHRRRSRRRLPPALMAKKKPPKKQPSDRLPTGATNPSSSKQPSSAPDSSSAAKSKKPSVSALAGSPTQTTQTPIPAQEVFIPILAIDTETPKSKTLATVNPIYAIGYEGDSCHRRHYKILRFIDAKIQEDFLLYETSDFGSSSWMRQRFNGFRGIKFFGRGVSLKGNTYWCATDSLKQIAHMVCFDFTRMRFRGLQTLPFPHRFEHLVILSCVRDEKLSVLLQSRESLVVDIWISDTLDEQKIKPHKSSSEKR
ncbi:unnamed protein product [Brassica oleracea]